MDKYYLLALALVYPICRLINVILFWMMSDRAAKRVAKSMESSSRNNSMGKIIETIALVISKDKSKDEL